MRLDELYCQPRVSIEYFADQPRFFGLKTIRQKDYRVLRVKVTNIGGERLYGLKAQVRLANKYYSYSGDDLTLMEESLPIIQRILYRHESTALPRPRTSFSLLRGDHQFVNVAMQVSEDGKWSSVELCLSAIAADNYSNILNVQNPVKFDLLILGELQPPRSESFVLFLDKDGVLQMKKEEAA